ncbi:MAG: dihydroorotate dehydrogenase-like protein [Saprospiraceae bacterium]|nr:dihydroorotate dehydrogenase-like protein [Saprospiraceae bacterium]
MNLSTTYMGMTLKSPLVVSASPLSENLDNIKQMEDAGAGAVVLFSLFEEQIRQEAATWDYLTGADAESFDERLRYLPLMDDFRIGIDAYFELIRKAKEAVDIPIIGSLNGITADGWVDYARACEDAGADGIELNVFFVPADINQSGAEVEHRYLNVLRMVKERVEIPVALKVSPYFSSFGHSAKLFSAAGADALVMFNRFYEPDFNIDTLEIVNSLDLSVANEIRLPLLWLGILYGKINASLAATTGVQGSTEVIKYLLAGADVAMTASCLLKNGIPYIYQILAELEVWMQARDFHSVAEMQGIMSQMQVAEPEAYERANYIKALKDYRF